MLTSLFSTAVNTLSAASSLSNMISGIQPGPIEAPDFTSQEKSGDRMTLFKDRYSEAFLLCRDARTWKHPFFCSLDGITFYQLQHKEINMDWDEPRWDILLAAPGIDPFLFAWYAEAEQNPIYTPNQSALITKLIYADAGDNDLILAVGRFHILPNISPDDVARDKTGRHVHINIFDSYDLAGDVNNDTWDVDHVTDDGFDYSAIPIDKSPDKRPIMIRQYEATSIGRYVENASRAYEHYKKEQAKHYEKAISGDIDSMRYLLLNSACVEEILDIYERLLRSDVAPLARIVLHNMDDLQVEYLMQFIGSQDLRRLALFFMDAGMDHRLPIIINLAGYSIEYLEKLLHYVENNKSDSSHYQQALSALHTHAFSAEALAEEDDLRRVIDTLTKVYNEYSNIFALWAIKHIRALKESI